MKKKLEEIMRHEMAHAQAKAGVKVEEQRLEKDVKENKNLLLQLALKQLEA